MKVGKCHGCLNVWIVTTPSKKLAQKMYNEVKNWKEILKIKNKINIYLKT